MGVESEKTDARKSTIDAIESALRKAGIEFLGEDGAREGVRMRHKLWAGQR